MTNNDEEYVPYPGVEPEKKIIEEHPQASEGTWFKEKGEVSRVETTEEKRIRLREKKEKAVDEELDKELKRLDYEEKHQGRIKLRKRTKKIGRGIRTQAENARRNLRTVGHEVKHYRERHPPRVLPRPRGMRMAPPPSVRANINKEGAVTDTTERNFFSSPSGPAQEKDFFGPPKLLDLIGNTGEQKKQVDYIGNSTKKQTDFIGSGNKKKVRYY
jgi:hypothetical protein